MKKLSITLSVLFYAILLNAQSPHAFKYQAVVRDNAGIVLANQNVSFQISILQEESSASTIVVYTETHDTTTNEFGLVNLEIGNGAAVPSGSDLTTINWGDYNYFLQVEMDETGGTNYQLMGTSQMLSVPYSLYAERAEYIDDADADPTNEIQFFSISGDTLFLSNGNYVILRGVSTILPHVCGEPITDIEGNVYNTVQMYLPSGNQCWMANNLATTKYNDSTDIPLVTDNTAWANLTTPGYCWYDNDQANYGNTYGVIYNGYAVSEGNLCPTGWHVPSDAEWTALTTSLGGLNVAGGKLKEINPHWTYPNTGATNETGFRALPGGSRGQDGSFCCIGQAGNWWSSTEYSSGIDWWRSIEYNNSNAYRNTGAKVEGRSVRCMRGESQSQPNLPPSQPSNPTPENGGTSQSINTTLSWACSDPENDPLSYNVYFGETNPPDLATYGQVANTYGPGLLNYNTTYYWKITAHDDHTNSTVGSVWSFTTEIQTWWCGDILLDNHDSQTYNTIQIGTQCWMAENLNIGAQINGSQNQTNNSTIEKYCYDDDPANCDTYGGLYQWGEMMEYTTIEGTQGICPAGWHLPTEWEWCSLENVVDAGTVSCTTEGWRGIDAGLNLKSISGWNSNGNGTDLFGFTALPGGYKGFGDLGNYCYWWNSSVSFLGDIWIRGLGYNNDQVGRFKITVAGTGHSIRCLRD